MIEFLWVVLKAPGWFYAVLIFCAVTAWLAYDLRSLTVPSAWVALGLFYVWVAASNSWHFVAQPDAAQFDRPEALAEAWRMWAVNVYETLIFAYLVAGAITAGLFAWVVWGAYARTVRFSMLAVFYGFVVFLGQFGEGLQRYVCKTNDDWLGQEHMYRVYGGEREACGRLFVKIFESFNLENAEPLGGFVGPLFFPTLTVMPLLIILFWTWHKRKDRA